MINAAGNKRVTASFRVAALLEVSVGQNYLKLVWDGVFSSHFFFFFAARWVLLLFLSKGL